MQKMSSLVTTYDILLNHQTNINRNCIQAKLLNNYTENDHLAVTGKSIHVFVSKLIFTNGIVLQQKY